MSAKCQIFDFSPWLGLFSSGSRKRLSNCVIAWTHNYLCTNTVNKEFIFLDTNHFTKVAATGARGCFKPRNLLQVYQMKLQGQHDLIGNFGSLDGNAEEEVDLKMNIYL